MPVRKRKDKRRTDLPDGAVTWLHGEQSEWPYFVDPSDRADCWHQYGVEIVAEHIARHPGTRPTRWWEYDAPKLSDPGKFWDGQLPEHRRQLGGSGGQWPSCVPHSWFGVPYLADVDPNDPPIFESEASYLDRHGLLTAAERRRLRPADFEPVAIQ